MKTVNLTKTLLGIATFALIACSDGSGAVTNPDSNADIGGNPSAGLEITENGDGTFTDNRDGRVYKTVVIGEQTWMAENIKFKPTEGENYCFDAKEENCENIGRLYTWKTAQSICPAGYHLPSDNEWDALIQFVLDDNLLYSMNYAAAYLKSTTAWKKWTNIVNYDKYGFNAIPAGELSIMGTYMGMDGTSANFWSSTEYTRDEGIFYKMDYMKNELKRSTNLKVAAYPIRCIKG